MADITTNITHRDQPLQKQFLNSCLFSYIKFVLCFILSYTVFVFFLHILISSLLCVYVFKCVYCLHALLEKVYSNCNCPHH